MYSYSYLESFCCFMSITNCCFLTCLHISQEADQVAWYSTRPAFRLYDTENGNMDLVMTFIAQFSGRKVNKWAQGLIFIDNFKDIDWHKIQNLDFGSYIVLVVSVITLPPFLASQVSPHVWKLQINIVSRALGCWGDQEGVAATTTLVSVQPKHRSSTSREVVCM